MIAAVYTPLRMKAFVARFGYPVWMAFLVVFALLHGLHLAADFPRHSPWPDWARFTDEGWYANAAIRLHLGGHWHHPGGFNPAVAVPLWPALVWLLFFVTGVSLVAIRALAVALFCASLLLTERLLRPRVPRWAALLALTLLVTSPFLYAFSRLALLEPLLLTLTLLALVVALGLPVARSLTRNAALLGLLVAAMILAKTTAVFLLPAILWAAAWPLRAEPRRLRRAFVTATLAASAILGGWLAAILRLHLLGDLTYFFFINRYPQPHTLAARLASLGWSLHGALWIDPILLPVLGLLLLLVCARPAWAAALLRDPLFVASLLAIAGYIAYMAAQNHTQPRYYTIVAVFSFLALAQLLAALLGSCKIPRSVGALALLVVLGGAAHNAAVTLQAALHPEYTWITAARALTACIKMHSGAQPDARRLLLATSGDEITLMTGLPAANDDFGTDLPERRIERAQPGWFATWNDLDPAILAALHRSYALRQIAVYPVMDDSERNRLVLFRLVPHEPAPGTRLTVATLGQILPEDRIAIPVE